MAPPRSSSSRGGRSGSYPPSHVSASGRSAGRSGGHYIEQRLGSRFLPGGIALMIIAVLTTLISFTRAGEAIIAGYLLVCPGEALWPRPYQLLTGPLIVTSPFTLVFLGLLLYSLGSAIEERLGTRRFLWICALASVAAAFAAALTGLALAPLLPGLAQRPVTLEAGPVFMVVLLGFARLYGHLPVSAWGIGQPMSGRVLSYFFIGVTMVSELFRRDFAALGASFGALAATALLLRSRDSGGDGFGRLSAWLGRLGRRYRPGAPRIEVLDGGRRGERWVN